MKRLVLAALALAAPLHGYAGSTHLCWTWNDVNKEWREIKLVTDDENKATGITVGGAPYSYSQIKSGTRIAVPGDGGREVVRISGPNTTQENGGLLTMKYLRNGISKDFGYYTMRLKRDETSNEWLLVDSVSGKKLKHLYFYKNEVFIAGLVGIDRVEPKISVIKPSREKATASIESMGRAPSHGEAAQVSDSATKRVASKAPPAPPVAAPSAAKTKLTI